MALVRPKTVGKADGKLVSQLVKEYLAMNKMRNTF